GMSTKSRSISLKSTGGDAQLEWKLPQLNTNGGNAVEIVLWLVIMVVIGLLSRRVLPDLMKDQSYVVYALIIVLTSVVVMSSVSNRNVHPDEYVHIRAAQFYSKHLLPVKACEESSRFTYSVYGASRLNSNEIYYYLAGRLLRLMQPIPGQDFFKLRALNVGMLLLLVILAIKVSTFRWFVLPLLFSPQLWYAFSYVNSEAMGITVATLAAWMAFGGGLKKLFETEKVPWKTVLMLGVLCGLLLLQKQTFYFVLAFAGMTAALWIIFSRQWNYIAFGAQRLLPLILVALCIWGGVELIHQSINDFERKEQVADCVRELARKAYNPDTPLAQTSGSLYWKAKGRPFSDLIEAKWGTRVFSSAFGYYGYLYVPGSVAFYTAIKVALGGLFGLLFWVTLRNGTVLARAGLVSMLICFCGLVGATMWNSWSMDFQPQGRYFFSLATMLGVLLYLLRDHLPKKPFFIISLLLTMLSTFSFVFVGILEVVK
ncbi:MAG: hypothetical protein ACI9FD_001174, partial [Gammaproteobacteria bacterium]